MLSCDSRMSNNSTHEHAFTCRDLNKININILYSKTSSVAKWSVPRTSAVSVGNPHIISVAMVTPGTLQGGKKEKGYGQKWSNKAIIVHTCVLLHCEKIKFLKCVIRTQAWNRKKLAQSDMATKPERRTATHIANTTLHSRPASTQRNRLQV